MTSERSKHRDFLSLIFISKSISKKLLIIRSPRNLFLTSTLRCENEPTIIHPNMAQEIITVFIVNFVTRTPCSETT